VLEKHQPRLSVKESHAPWDEFLVGQIQLTNIWRGYLYHFTVHSVVYLITTPTNAYIAHLSYCSLFVVCWIFGVVGLEWYPCCRLKYKLYGIIRIVLGSLCVGVSVWLGWSGIRVAG